MSPTEQLEALIEATTAAAELVIPKAMLEAAAAREEDTDEGEWVDELLTRFRFAVAFPLLTEVERSCILALDHSRRGLILGVNMDRSEIAPYDRGPLESLTDTAEEAFMFTAESVRNLIANGRFTDAQVGYLEKHLLAVPFEE